MATVLFILKPSEVAEIMKPAKGSGGHQSLMLHLQSLVDQNTGEIELDDDDIGKIVRYSGYGQGGFQSRFRAAFRRSLREWMDR